MNLQARGSVSYADPHNQVDLRVFLVLVKTLKAAYSYVSKLLGNLFVAILISPIVALFSLSLAVILYRSRKVSRLIPNMSYFDLKQLTFTIESCYDTFAVLDRGRPSQDSTPFLAMILIDQIQLVHDSFRSQLFAAQDCLEKYNQPSVDPGVFRFVSDDEVWQNRPKSKSFGIA